MCATFLFVCCFPSSELASQESVMDSSGEVRAGLLTDPFFKDHCVFNNVTRLDSREPAVECVSTKRN